MKKKPLRKNSICKILAILAYVISIPVACLGILGTLELYNGGYYYKELSEIQKSNFESKLSSDIWLLNENFMQLQTNGYFDETVSKQRKEVLYQEFMQNYANNKTNFSFAVYDMDDNLLIKSGSDNSPISQTYFHEETENMQSEKIMSEADYQRFCNTLEGEYVINATQMIVPRGEPAPTLPNSQNELIPETEVTEIIPSTTNIPETTELVTEPDTTDTAELVTEPNTTDIAIQEMSDTTESNALLENVFPLTIQANAENIPLAVEVDYSIDEMQAICDALNISYHYTDNNFYLLIENNDTGVQENILFQNYLQEVLKQNPDLYIIKQDDWHYVINYHNDPPSVIPIQDYAALYFEEFTLDSYPVDNNNIDEPQYYDIYYDVRISEPITTTTHYIIGYVNQPLKAIDSYKTAQDYTMLAYQYRYAIPIIGVLAAILCFVSFIFAIASAGYRTGSEYAVATSFDKIPYDIFTAILGCIGIVASFIAVDNIGNEILLFGILLPLWAIIILWWAMSTATRVRTKTIIENTVIYKIFRLTKKQLLKSSEKAKQAKEQVKEKAKLLDYLPFVWKAGLVATGVVLLDIISVIFIWDRIEFGLLLKILFWAVGIAGTIFVVYQLHLLEVGGQNLANGKLDEKIKLERLFSVFKKHAENLNCIGDGMNKAVSDRLKSEMFKTELIANVSHDIRTPLTSIINYTDLLSKLNLTDKQAIEYISVLQRQSARLRKLTEDVLEASKATAGTMKTEKEIMDIKVLLEQLIGEYTERFEAKNLTLINEISEQNLIVSADGKLLWRAMDNLFGNICKYAMPQTRVYLHAYPENHEIIITLRNISAVQLNISADALMERFVRGDRSRNTDGSGLGLSIAQSFIELQGGKLSLYIDGDLFKVKIQLPENQAIEQINLEK
ncbi:MAG: HAMP domain-containing histidine kinase [Oscillospiraceae bacterium]|nr:HAMP domain-containing histidine kinase [Oscillospiraceae bacterium]